jgi:lipopolysaccharide transport system ATP-binding protein
MIDQVLSAERVGKKYRLGRNAALHSNIRSAIASGLRRGPGRKPDTVDDSRTLWALRDVSFEVRAGERVGIIGRNGAGKSTLLKIVSRLTEPTEGRVRGRGRVATLLEVGTGFHQELSGRENIFLSGAIMGMKRAEIVRRFDEIVAFSELERFLDTPVKRYSSGMYIRLAFAVAAHLEPEILVVDEVLAVGDLAFQKKCLGRMSEVAGEGRTVLFVSHNMGAIKTLCERVLLIDHGQLKLDADTNTAIAAYVDATWPIRADGVIPDRVRDLGTGDALLRRVVIQNRDGEMTDKVFLGEPFRIVATYEVLKRVDDAVMEVGLSTVEGMRIASVGNMDGNRAALVFEPGMRQVAVEVEGALLPNDFVVDVAMHHVGGLTVDWVERATSFTALNIARDSPDHYRWHVVRGFLRPSSRWFGPEEVRD